MRYPNSHLTRHLLDQNLMYLLFRVFGSKCHVHIAPELRKKLHFVVQGFSQVWGIDYDNTFSPTVHLDSLQILFHLAASFRRFCAQDDVTGAFLHPEIDHNIYVRQPKGFEDGTQRVLHLLLSLYGLKQASRLWNQYMHRKLTGLGWE
jgi:hypothetical protein